jgi:glycosyltransferase involved in cell wall biosynthesis
VSLSECFAKLKLSLSAGDVKHSNDLILNILDRIDRGGVAYDYLVKICGLEMIQVLKTSFPVIYLVTPSYNSVETMGETIESVVSQRGNFLLYYHVQDGGSSDGTVELLKEYKDKISNEYSSRVVFTYSSCRDSGMYDALYKGFDCFNMSGNSWMGWINSDDQLADGVLDLLSKLASQRNIGWLTGQPSIKMLDGVIKNHNVFYSNQLIKSGLCDGRSWWFLQQEGTFWRAGLWSDLCRYSHFNLQKFAGDYHLWRVLADLTELYQYDGPTGHFNKREGQISSACLDKYYSEIDCYWDRFISRPQLRKYSTHEIKRVCVSNNRMDVRDVRFRVDGKFCVRAV